MNATAVRNALWRKSKKEGLLHISEISWKRLETMDGIFSVIKASITFISDIAVKCFTLCVTLQYHRVTLLLLLLLHKIIE